MAKIVDLSDYKRKHADSRREWCEVFTSMAARTVANVTADLVSGDVIVMLVTDDGRALAKTLTSLEGVMLFEGLRKLYEDLK